METYKRLLRYIKPYKLQLLLGFVLILLSGVAEVLVSGVIYVTTNGLMNREFVTLKDIPHLPSDWVISFSVIWIPFIIVSVFVVKGVLAFSSKAMLALVGLKSVRDIQNDLFRHVSYLSCDYFSEKRSGDLSSRITGDVRGVQNAITTVILDAIKSPITIVCTIPVIIFMGGWVSVISIVVFPLVAIPIVLLGKKFRKIVRGLLESSADILSFLSEVLPGMKIIKAFNAEEQENKVFNQITNRICKLNIKSVLVEGLQRPVIEIMGACGVAIAIYFALKTLPFDRFATFAGSLYLLYEPAKKLSKINVVIQQALASGTRIFEVMDQKSSIQDPEVPLEIVNKVETIAFRNICFNYGGDVEVLKGVSCDVTHGETVAIVGPSGSGKSTLVNLLPRFYDPQDGSVLLNGTDIRSFRLKELRSLIGLVSQDTVLFSGTIKENIAYGKPQASKEEIENAAKAANAHDFILALEDGYDTKVGERGSQVSGGQRQRISIARAILKNPPILIFDEATSQLDTQSEREVQNAIDNLMTGRTVFVIAHRLSTVKNANKILVVDNGKIVQQGTHDELIGVAGLYKNLCALQFTE